MTTNVSTLSAWTTAISNPSVIQINLSADLNISSIQTPNNFKLVSTSRPYSTIFNKKITSTTSPSRDSGGTINPNDNSPTLPPVLII